MRRLGQIRFAAIALLAAGIGASARAQGPDNIEEPAPAVLETDTMHPGQATDGLAVRATGQTPGTVTLPLPAGCDTRTSAIGLARIVEIDTSGGPRFGRSQYKDVDFLQDGEVVLTFDDGPLRRYTKPVLDTLDAHCTRATFFSVGRMAVADPETLKETARRGHTIASHTWSHAKLRTLPLAKAKYEIELGNSAVTKAMGAPITPFFRFPYLGDNRSTLDYLRSRNMSPFSIEVDSQDFKTRNPGQVLRNVMAQLKTVKKGIILFHDIQPATAGALSSILDALKAGGYRVVHLVSKTTNTTLPEFDAIAEREMERRRLKLGGQPLANRAVTWPNQVEGAETAVQAADPKAKVMPGAVRGAGMPDTKLPGGDAYRAPTDRRPSDAPQISGPPVASGADSIGSGAPPATRPLRKPLWQGGLDDGDPWRIKTLGD